MSDIIFQAGQWTTLGGWGSVAGIILLSYLLEDAALIAAAVLAVAGALSPLTAWLAAFFGIFTGDLAVYLTARRLRKPLTRGRKAWPEPSLKELVVCRFTPGLRTVSYGWCGMSGMALSRFSRIVFWSGLVWTLAVFGLVFLVGDRGGQWLGYYKWIVVPLVGGWLVWRRARSMPAFMNKESLIDE